MHWKCGGGGGGGAVGKAIEMGRRGRENTRNLVVAVVVVEEEGKQ